MRGRKAHALGRVLKRFDTLVTCGRVKGEARDVCRTGTENARRVSCSLPRVRRGVGKAETHRGDS